MSIGTNDYHLSASDAAELRGLVLMPASIRRQILVKYAAMHGADALVELFTQFVGMANAVVANNRELIEQYAITELKLDFHQAEKLNLPTLYGAASGAVLAQGITAKGRCHGCALRVGSVANQSSSTVGDVIDCLEEINSVPFVCHEQANPESPSAKRCVGFRQAIKNRAKAGLGRFRP